MKKTIKFEVIAEIDFDKPEGEQTAIQSVIHAIGLGRTGIGCHADNGGYQYKVQAVKHAPFIDEMKFALEKIAHPIAYLKREADRTNAKLDGQVACYLSNDASWLKEIAKDVIDKINENEKTQG